jgi:lipoprotein-releasing system ATP-binding protein
LAEKVQKPDIAVKAVDLSKSYFARKEVQTQVLKNLNVDIHKGKITALMGPSGVGKSTLLHLLGSLDTPDSGEIKMFDGTDEINYSSIKSDDLAKVRNQKIGFIFQFSHLLPEFTAIENVMIPALIAGLTNTEAKQKANELLKLVDVIHRKDHKPMELSGGEQQRVAIARAIINNPIIVFADEPTGNLDSKNAESILNLIKELKEKYGNTFLIATHSKDVSDMADRILLMGDGIIIEEIVQ